MNEIRLMLLPWLLLMLIGTFLIGRSCVQGYSECINKKRPLKKDSLYAIRAKNIEEHPKRSIVIYIVIPILITILFFFVTVLLGIEFISGKAESVTGVVTETYTKGTIRDTIIYINGERYKFKGDYKLTEGETYTIMYTPITHVLVKIIEH